jgi:anti-sigma-K factor RskA
MTTGDEALNEHDKFRELAAMATAGTLTAAELAELKSHLPACEECREAYWQYQVLAREGFPMLAAGYDHKEAEDIWDDRATRANVFARIGAAERRATFGPTVDLPASRGMKSLRPLWPAVRTAVAACVTVAVGFGAYYLGSRTETRAKRAVASVAASAEDRAQRLASEKKAVDDLLSGQARKLTELQAESSQKQQQIDKLGSELQALQDRSDALTVGKTNSDERLRTVAQQRDSLAEQLRDAEQAYQSVQVELTNLRAERDKTTLRLASLETQVDELSTANRNQQMSLDHQQQFLSSDRDIRELMGARNLYIADVFDVDSRSRTSKPFGRVFYTQGKSLIFYAFDLDRQPGIKNAAFQAWGQRELPQGEKAQPVSLGILYMDNQTNRRWALHCDDPKQLAEIDAVFVTVEPSGGSSKPTGKQLLYALLRKEANHP